MMSRFKNWINRMHLRTKFLGILSVSLLFMLLGQFLIAHLEDKAYNELLYKQNTQLLTLLSHSIQTELENTAMESFSVIADNVLQNSLTVLHKAAQGSEEWLKAKTSVTDRLMNISLMESNINSIYLKSKDGVVFSRVRDNNDFPDGKMNEWEQKAKEARGREVWLPNPDNQNSIFLVRDFREVADLTLNSIATLVLRINMNRIVDKCFEGLNELEIPFRCQIELDGIPIFTNDVRLSSVQMNENDFALQQYEDTCLFCVRYVPQKSRWTYTLAQSYDNILSSINRSTILVCILSVLALLISLLLGSLLVNRIVIHFQKLLQKYNAFAQGSYVPDEHDPYRARNDEIGELHVKFDSMAMEHQRMVDDIFEKQKLLLESRIRQLRAQIQPHFLYNTLESICCLAQKNSDKRIVVMTSSLGHMLRSTLKDNRDIITVREDLQISKDYLNIQMVRYANKLVTSFDIAGEYMSLSIPTMTIQPLVENAVKYAVEQMTEQSVIRIFCERSGQYVHLIVEDNGPGIDENILDNILEGKAKAEGNGIGLANIHNRLRLSFNDAGCGLKFKRVNDRTQVIVCLPGEVRNHD